jgi:Protein of unknown function (DUF3108)
VLAGNARLSAMFGTFKWSSDTRSSGRILGDAPHPSGFTFDFKSNSKVGSTKLGFANDKVTTISHMPPQPPKPGTVPLKQEHLDGVLDPLSAVMALTRSSAANPCNRKIAVFDGKQRFDLVFSLKGQARITEQKPSGQPGVGVVCKVKYVPIAGHKLDSEQRAMSISDGIEIILRPIPDANVYVPYQITIPTGAGPAKIVSKRVDIVNGGRPIALVH